MAAQSNGKKKNRSSRPSHKKMTAEKRWELHKAHRIAKSITRHRHSTKPTKKATHNIPPNMGSELRLAVNSVLRSKREAEI